MKARLLILAIICSSLFACNEKDTTSPGETSQSSDTSENDDSWEKPQLSLTPMFDGKRFSKPIGLYQATDNSWFLVEQQGKILRIQGDNFETAEFLDITDRVKLSGEMGLLGFAFDPDFNSNGVFYVSYTDDNDFSIISSFDSQNMQAMANSEKEIFKIKQPYGNHNGGQIGFGPDGYLYIGLGDGGSAGDPQNNGQNKSTLLGAMLRIDITDDKSDYRIPQDNPFRNEAASAEIYAYGLRNPWRWSFDKKTGELWLADVGQNEWEEINIIEIGGNYGWNILEGTNCFQFDDCDSSNLKLPVYEYSHSEGSSVTGGYVYRGNAIQKLQSIYVYGDFGSGTVWGLRKKSNGSFENHSLFKSGHLISSFAEDNSGNLYLIAYDNGIVYSINE